MSKLKHCPFCGGKAKLKQSKAYPNVWMCGCKKCDVIFYKQGSKAALKAWNKRYERTCKAMPSGAGEDIACSNCGAYNIGQHRDSGGHLVYPSYCPNCGAEVKSE